MRTIGEFPRVLKSAASLREPHRVCRYLEDLAGDYHRFYDSCRVLPQGDEAPGDLHAARLALCAATRQVIANGLRSSASALRSGCERASRRSPARRGDPPRRRPRPSPAIAAEMLALAPNVWPRNAVRGADGVVSIAGVPVTELAAEYGTPLFVIDEDDFRSRCRDIADAFGGGEHVRYAAKAFLCTEVARWIDEEGLSLDVCSGGELAVALHADFPPERIALHGNNKSVAELDGGGQGRCRARGAGLDDRDRPARRHRG